VSSDLARDCVQYLRSSGVSTPTYARVLPAPVERSGSSAIVIQESSPWATPSVAKTQRYPRIVVLIYSDCSRDLSGSPIRDDGPEHAMTIWREVDRYLHDIAHNWSDVISSARERDPETMGIPAQDGSVMLSTSYAVVVA
jgi:hypothetical protein